MHVRKSLFKRAAGLAYKFIKKKTVTRAFACEFCKISKNIYFTEHLWTAASGVSEECYSLFDLFSQIDS